MAIATSSITQSGETTLPDQTGNSGKYLTTDGSTATWDTVATKEIHTAITTYATSFTLNSTSAQDVTNATVTSPTVDASKTYTATVWATNLQILDSTGNIVPYLWIDINGTDGAIGQTREPTAGGRQSQSPSHMIKGLTGSTSYTAKVQGKVNTGSVVLNTNTENQAIFMILVEE